MKKKQQKQSKSFSFKKGIRNKNCNEKEKNEDQNCCDVRKHRTRRQEKKHTLTPKPSLSCQYHPHQPSTTNRLTSNSAASLTRRINTDGQRGAEVQVIEAAVLVVTHGVEDLVKVVLGGLHGELYGLLVEVVVGREAGRRCVLVDPAQCFLV